MRKGFLLVLLITLAGIMIMSVSEMPGYGNTDVPSYNENTDFYLENATKQANSPNVVTAIVSDFRAVNTLGVIIVLFISIVVVKTVLYSNKPKEGDINE